MSLKRKVNPTSPSSQEPVIYTDSHNTVPPKKYIARNRTNIPKVIWIYGASCTGKSDLAHFLTTYLMGEIKKEHSPYYAMGVKNVIHLDGDVIRRGLCSDLSLNMEGRRENIRRAAELARLLTLQNDICVCSFVTPMRGFRRIIYDTFDMSTNPNRVYFVYLYSSDSEKLAGRDKDGIYKVGNIYLPTMTPPAKNSGWDKALSIDTVKNGQVQTRSILINSLKELWYEPLKK